MFFKLAALRQKNIQFQPYWPFFFDNWLRRAKGLWQINGNSLSMLKSKYFDRYF
jgi:hypothetical protein